MKTRNIFAALLLMIAGVQTVNAQKVTVRTKDNNKVVYKVPQSIVIEGKPVERRSIFFDFSFATDSRDGSNICEKRSGILYKPNGGGWKAEGKQLVPLNVNGAYYKNHLRKVAAQGNAGGYENVVYASWSRPFRVAYTDNNRYTNTPSVSGDGTVTITVYGDSAHNHAAQMTSRKLLKADGSDYVWNMTQPSDNSYWRVKPGTSSSFKDGTYLSDFKYQYFARAFNLNCIQDQTGDGVEEIVMNVADRIAVFDGVTMRCLRQRTYSGTGTPYKRANLRFDVADVNNDGCEDIVVVAYTDVFQTTLDIFDKGHIDEAPILTNNINRSAFYCDIKVGNVSGSNMPEIVVFTRGAISATNTDIASYGYVHLFRLDYRNNNMRILTLPTHSIDFSTSNGPYRGLTGNLNLVLGYFRGHSYGQDLVVGDQLWRWDEGKRDIVYKSQMLPQTKNNFYAISADAIAAVTLQKNGKESLMYFEDYYMLCGWTVPRSNTKLCERWLDADGVTVKSSDVFGANYFGWANSQIVRYFNTESVAELLAHPVLCKFADRERPESFKLKDHQSNSSINLSELVYTFRYKDGNIVKYDIPKVESFAFEDYEYVEIAGTKWATMNVGASTVAGSYETCFGDYFTWGESQPRYTSLVRTSLNEATINWKSGFYDESFPSFAAETLDDEHDPATFNWSSEWRTPTAEEFHALFAACSENGDYNQAPEMLTAKVTAGGIYWLSETQTYEPEYTGVPGMLCVSKTDISKRVFFPASGHIIPVAGYSAGVGGSYWTSSRANNSDQAHNLYFALSYISWSESYRIGMFTIRPVKK